MTTIYQRVNDTLSIIFFHYVYVSNSKMAVYIISFLLNLRQSS